MGNYQNESFLSDEFVEKLGEYLENIYNENIGKTLILDFQNIGSCNRAFKDYNSKIFLKQLVFANIKASAVIKERIEESLKKLNIEAKNDYLFFSLDKYRIGYAANINFKTNYEKKIVEIFRENNVITNNTGESDFLDSSGIYSTAYIHIKRIFYSFHDYLYIIYKLAEKIADMNIDKIDAIISTSKTGGIVASLVGNLLGIKVVHCLGLGPKNIMPIETINEKLRKGRNYFLVSDFICLGTEIKIINTIMMCSKARLIGGVSIASYIDLSSKNYIDSVVGKMSTLINIIEHGVKYEISGYKFKGEKND